MCNKYPLFAIPATYTLSPPSSPTNILADIRRGFIADNNKFHN